MMRKPTTEIDKALLNIKEIEKLHRLYFLSIFWKNAIYPKNYSADESWPSILFLSKEGEYFYKAFKELGNLNGDAQLYLNLFEEFFYHDLLFDWQLIDVSKIEALLEKEILTKKIFFPYKFGRCLYDRFNDNPKINRENFLIPNDTAQLIDGTPIGVYQLGNIVIGPLGLFNSIESRIIRPILNLPLWHCSDTGCSAIHFVNLHQDARQFDTKFRLFNELIEVQFGPKSEWDRSLLENQRLHSRKKSNIIELIANGVLGAERKSLLIYALKGKNKTQLREILSSPSRHKNFNEGSPEIITEKLSCEERLQLLMAVEDDLLIEYLDELVSKKTIKIPLGEKRRQENFAGRVNDEYLELSSLGIRTISDNAIIKLSELVWNSYEKEGIINELEWKVKLEGNKNIRDSLFDFIKTYGPTKVIKEIILSSNAVTKNICKEIRLSLSLVKVLDELTVERMLWKLGFDPEEYDDLLCRIQRLLQEFKEKVLSVSPVETEDDRAAIRSIGVNVFVALEHFLDRLISFNVWLLSSDHFVANKFHFDLDSARNNIIKVIGPTLIVDGVAASWSPKGDNSLGTLLRYLSKTVEWVASLIGKESKELNRNHSDLPFFVKDKLRPFPFQSTQFWADADQVELVKYKDMFLTISQLIQQSKLAFIRNGIDHFRESNSFPNEESLLHCIEKIKQAVELSDINRFFPKPYWLISSSENRYGIIVNHYKDYASRELLVYGPPIASGLPKRSYKYPVIIAPLCLIGYPNSQLMFQLRERSEYTIYWENYPRRIKLTSTEENAYNQHSITIDEKENKVGVPLPTKDSPVIDK